ncbi:trypsin inhibitor-like cysteine-rich domain-containing protein [Pyxidicoccus sp. 3LG]
MRTHAPLLALAAVLATTGCVVGDDEPLCGPSTCREPHRTQCVVEGDEARCLCDPGYVSRPSGACEPVSEANCADHAGDAAEPDDCQARARLLVPDGRPHLQSIDPIGDLDFFRFEAREGRIYSVTVVPEGSSLLPRVDAFDQGGAWLDSVDGRPRVDMTFKTPTTAPYFLRVSHSPLDISAATGPYVLTFTELGEDDHGDGPDRSTRLVPDPLDPVFGRFEFRGDEDWFEFSASTTRTYRLDFDGGSGRALPVVEVYLASDLRQPLLSRRNPTVEFTVPANGTAFLVLYLPNGEQGSYAFDFLE